MNFQLLFGAVAIAGSALILCLSMTSKPSVARANLFSGIEETPVERKSLFGSMVKLAGRIVPERLTGRYGEKLAQAGNPKGLDAGRFVGLKVVASVISFVMFVPARQPLLLILFAAVGFFLPDVWLRSRLDARGGALRKATAEIADQLTTCVEAGLGFDAALHRVATTHTGPLAEELRRTLTDIQAGVPRAQALHGMAERARVPEIRALVRALTQAQQHGVPLADALRIQSAEMRDKHRQSIEEQAAKLPVKILFPTLLCILPATFIVLVGPTLVNLTHSLGHH